MLIAKTAFGDTRDTWKHQKAKETFGSVKLPKIHLAMSKCQEDIWQCRNAKETFGIDKMLRRHFAVPKCQGDTWQRQNAKDTLGNVKMPRKAVPKCHGGIKKTLQD